MTEILKPSNLDLTWASSGDVLDPGDTKYATGWQVEIPPRQWFNYLGNRQDRAIAHINQRGVAQWDATTEYQGSKSYTQSSTGVIYRSRQTNTNQEPDADVGEVYWEVAFDRGVQATETAAGIAEIATTAEAQAGSDDLRIMTPLKVKQSVEQFSKDFLNTTRIDVAGASTVNLTTAAPNTRHINITGTTTINGFTVAAGQCYFVRFNAALTLTNSASLVTQAGGNIVTQAGDTCIIRATAANTVEILCGNFLSSAGKNTLIVRDQRPSGTAGGTLTSGAWRTRPINTVQANTIPGASLASDQITLPAGTYDVLGYSVAYLTSTTQVALYNVTDSMFALIGSTERMGTGTNATGTALRLEGRLTIAATKVFEVQVQVNVTGTTNGFGFPAGFGIEEVFANIAFKKVG